ncbi:MAG TPA: biopolymer transporter ExbD [Candidatus Rubrimentiphilum sp.]|nr:biopolymer transporter ExbD [Candidatus Rubrimentiphilum sp.]
MTKFGAAAQESTLLSEINITPFTDVLLVLLIIFMVLAALLTPPGFERQFSNPGRSIAATVFQRVIVTIDRHGQIAVGGKVTSVPGLYAAMLRAGSKAHVSLYADTRSPYGLVIRVLDAAKAAGIRDVALVTQ